MSCVFQNIDPPPPSPPGECVLPPQQRRGVHTRRAEGGGGGGGSIFWKTQDIGLSSYSNNLSTLTMHIIRYSYGGGSGSIVTWAVATYKISVLASYLLAHTYKSTAVSKLSYSSYLKVAQCLYAPLSFWKRTPHLKRLHLFSFLGPKRCDRFFVIYSMSESIPLSVPKQHTIVYEVEANRLAPLLIPSFLAGQYVQVIGLKL